MLTDSTHVHSGPHVRPPTHLHTAAYAHSHVHTLAHACNTHVLFQLSTAA